MFTPSYISKLPFANADVRIMVGTSCRRATASKLCIAEGWKRSCYSGYQKWKRQCRSRMLPGNCPNKNVHPGSNRRPNTWGMTQQFHHQYFCWWDAIINITKTGFFGPKYYISHLQKLLRIRGKYFLRTSEVCKQATPKMICGKEMEYRLEVLYELDWVFFCNMN